MVFIFLLVIIPVDTLFGGLSEVACITGCVFFLLLAIPSAILSIVGLYYIVPLIYLVPVFIWMSIINHIVINGIDISMKPNLGESKFLYFTIRYDPKEDYREKLLVILAFIYIIAFLGFFVLGEFFQWDAFWSGAGRIILGLLALNMFWYAQRFSRTAILLSIIIANLLLGMSVFITFSIFLEYNLLLNLIVSNIGFLLLGSPILACKKTDPLRRILIINWMFWTAYCGIGLILSVPQYDPGVYAEFLAKFLEVSIVVATAYKYTEF